MQEGGRSFEAQRDLVGIGAGSDAEVVFKLTLIAVVHEGDARIDALVFDAPKLRNAAPPLGGIIADEIIALAGKRLGTVNARRGVGPVEPHSDDAASRRLSLNGGGLEGEHRLVSREGKDRKSTRLNS